MTTPNTSALQIYPLLIPSKHLPLSISLKPLVENVPRQLWIRQFLIATLTIILTVVGYATYQSYAGVVQTIGKDSVPSIVAAQQIQTTLANAHSNVANSFLTNGAVSNNYFKEYELLIGQGNNHLLTASQNITYGAAERDPILAMLDRLSIYNRTVGAAMTVKGFSENFAKADILMNLHILPAANQLSQANARELDKAYHQGMAHSKKWLYMFLALAGVLTVALLETQVKLHATFKRLISLPIAAGLIIFLVSVALFASQSHKVVDQLRVAKEDAFDSVLSLTRAQALAYAVSADESVFLLLHGNDMQKARGEVLDIDANQIFDSTLTEMTEPPRDLKTLKGHGLLGDELANITFPGEEAAAGAALTAWLDYIRIDKQIRLLELSEKHDEALALCLGKNAHESDWAFDRFIRALSVPIKINQDQFDLAIDNSFGAVRWLLFLLLPVLLAPILGSTVGLQKRISEFRE